MAMSRNAYSLIALPDFPESAQQLGMVSPKLPKAVRYSVPGTPRKVQN